MKLLKYVGFYDRQSYTKADFTRHGVPDEAAKAVSWDNGEVKEVSDEVAEFVQAHHPGNFVEVDEDGIVAGSERGEPAEFSNDDHNNVTLNPEGKKESAAGKGEGATTQTGVGDAPTGNSTSSGGPTGKGGGKARSSKSTSS
jgi:hypothetical protein